MKDFYKSPLSIYIVWHPVNEHGIKFGEAFYNTFCRDTESPLSRALGIPVNFRFEPSAKNGAPLEINTNESDLNAIILLVDDEMFDDENWGSYVRKLLDLESKSTRVFPVALSKYAFSLDEKRLSKKQFINLTKSDKSCENFEAQWKELRSRMLHDLSRFLFGFSRVADNNCQEEPPIKLFVSHAKIDGEKTAAQFRDYVQANTKLKAFFDVNDIEDAGDFANAIKGNLAKSAIIVFLSDQYSTRPWCQIEVVVAKRNKSPLVVVYNIDKGEKRSFPYLGNVPTIRLTQNNFDDIIDLALFQVLNNLFNENKLNKDIELHKLKEEYHAIMLENPPELFNFIDFTRIKKDHPGTKLLVLYPDPPLGHEEINILNDLDSAITFVTPSTIHTIA